MTRPDYDLSQLEGLSVAEMVFKIRKDLEFAMPPVGLTQHRASTGGVSWIRYTWRCDQPNCWYICTPRDKANAKELETYHKIGKDAACPSEPRRESLPSGLSEIEKLWREVDDIVAALKGSSAHRGLSGTDLKNYAAGIAFSIIMKEGALFEDARAVAAEGLARYEMRHGRREYRPTPTRFAADWSALEAKGGWRPEDDAPSLGPPPARRPPVRRGSKSAAVVIDSTKLQSIKQAIASGLFDDDGIALSYNVPVASVRALRAGG